MDKFVVRGGNRLEGDIYVSGAKNAAVAIIPAVILSDEPCTLENVPDISDVSIGLKILREMGAKVDMVDRTTFTIDATHLMNSEVPYDMARKMRASYYFLGACLGKFNKAMVVEMTHIPDAYFDKFIAFCNFSDDFLVNTSDFQIIMTICWQYESANGSVTMIAIPTPITPMN